MGFASQQEMEKRPEVKEPWTFRRLFSMGAISTLSKVFVNPFDVLLGFLVVVAGVGELVGREVSPFLWGIIALILVADLLERKSWVIPEPKEPKK